MHLAVRLVHYLNLLKLLGSILTSSLHAQARASSSNDTLFQTDDRVAPYHHFKTHTFVNQNTQTPTTAPSVQGYVNGPG
ncbi:hypothetical protein PR001_g29516, partial [Phytophthora rubi]